MSTRKNESSIVDAITDKSKLDVGNKVWLYYDKNDKLKDVDNYADDHETSRLLKKIFSGTRIFTSFMDMSLCVNLTLKKNYPILCDIMGWPKPEPKVKKVTKPRKKKNAGPELVCEPFDSETYI
jgi:hypothetical protein